MREQKYRITLSLPTRCCVLMTQLPGPVSAERSLCAGLAACDLGSDAAQVGANVRLAPIPVRSHSVSPGSRARRLFGCYLLSSFLAASFVPPSSGLIASVMPSAYSAWEVSSCSAKS